MDLGSCRVVPTSWPARLSRRAPTVPGAITGTEVGRPYDAGVPVARPDNEDRPLSALPSRKARLLAFSAILVAGMCGALIGSSFVSLQCEGGCETSSGVGAIVGGLIAAGGVAVVAVLVLRAMGEWNRIEESDRTAGGGGGPVSR